MVAPAPVVRLAAAAHEFIRRELSEGAKRGQKVYIVVKFEPPEGRVVVVAAEKAAKMRAIRCDRGGIPWDD